MRKIEKDMNAALREGRWWFGSNTAVSMPFDGVQLIYLHGHVIARVRNGIAEADIDTLRAWPTRTTVSRLRALGIDACVRKGVPCIDGKAI